MEYLKKKKTGDGGDNGRDKQDLESHKIAKSEGNEEGGVGGETDKKLLPKVVGSKILDSKGEFKWLRLNKISWIDEKNRKRQWESAERTTRKDEVDGVAIIAKLEGEETEPALILVSQFRPPTHSKVLELPAGLVDEGEDAGKAAVRELKEECGYVGTVEKISPVVFADPGMSNANMKYAFLKIDLNDPRNQTPVSEQEDGECIQTHKVPLSKLMEALSNPKEFFGQEFVVDARLFGFAQGFALGSSL